ncbi:hypothetical protein LJR071_001044 [Pseudomonas sp. LjRoot71]|uniref:hypothetical protein n=1 Tax=Pseudomonas sp. LjRoot71 TaxID=3342336 RepID=UPI003ECCBA44
MDGTQPQPCPICKSEYSFSGIGKHLNEKHGFTVPRKILRALARSPICQVCKGNGGCKVCKNTGFITLECDKPGHVKCVLCQRPIKEDQYTAHVEVHKVAALTYIKPQLNKASQADKSTRILRAMPIGSDYVPPAKAQTHLLTRPGGFALVLPKRTVITEKEKQPVVPLKHCDECGSDIASHAFERHLREMHPKAVARPKRKQKRKRKAFIPILLESDRAPVKSQSRDAVCPRCDGHGGIRGGCALCEGTGWVSAENERPTHANASALAGTISTYDYLGDNAGAHFREKGGRIGSMPVHDNYGEESEV